MDHQGYGISHAALERFADEASAHKYVEEILWPTGPICPHCGVQGRIGRLDGASTRLGAYKCYTCRKAFSVTYGTIFSSSHVPLHKWLQAIYLTDGGTKPIRPHHLQRILNVSFKTASSMLRKLEEAAATHDNQIVSAVSVALGSNDDLPARSTRSRASDLDYSRTSLLDADSTPQARQ